MVTLVIARLGVLRHGRQPRPPACLTWVNPEKEIAGRSEQTVFAALALTTSVDVPFALFFLLVDAKVNPRDIAFLRPGLPAKIKPTAYDFAIYGGLKAQVEHISADTFIEENGDPYYLVRVRTTEPTLVKDGKPFSIMPGMTAEVDILVGEKTVLSYLLKPVLRARENALREP